MKSDTTCGTMKGEHMKKLKVVGILAAVVLIGGIISVLPVNNHNTYKAEKVSSETSLPKGMSLVETLSQAGKLTGNRICMQYFEAILIRSELLLEEMNSLYSDYRSMDEQMHKKEIELVHNNFFENGVEGVLTDLDEALELPDELYIANKYQIAFDENGTIQSMYAFIYGQDENGEKKTYLIDYDADKSNNMTVWIDGHVNGEYEEDMRLLPMLQVLKNADWKNQVKLWSDTYEEKQIYEILYMGRRSFHLDEGLQYVSGDADGNGVETGTNNFVQLRNGGAIVGFEVSLHIPGLNSVTPVRYIMEPEYISQKELDQENMMQQVDEAKAAESWTVDQSDGTMYFFFDENNGWRLVVTDAAAGSRFYVMEKSVDGGTTWERINEDPFGGQIGVTEGLLFFDENFGFAGLTEASQSHSNLYVTRDGGANFEKLVLPMDSVTELPEMAEECDFTIEDYDYLNMPEKDGDTLIITVTTDAAETDGIVFKSIDNGITWKYSGITES